MVAFVSVLPETSGPRHTDPPHWKVKLDILAHVSFCAWKFPLWEFFFQMKGNPIAVSFRSVFFAPPRGKIFNLSRSRNWSIFPPSPLLSGHQSCVIFAKPQTCPDRGWKPLGLSSPRLLSHIVITVNLLIAINRLSQESRTPTFLPLCPLYSSTASVLIQIDRPVTRGRNLSEEELGFWRGGGWRCKHFITGSLQESFATGILTCL